MDRLDRNVVHEICTNQVVVTLHACVKELVENSLDAGATRIEIRLRESGSELLEVVDNGCGISPEDYSKVATRHATSKIREYDDLSQSLSTYGFRGEALAGICAMSDMTVCTRKAGDSMATLLAYDRFGKLSSQTPAAREVGTTVSARELFKRLPVRHREFMRNAKSQVSATLHLIQAYSIARPDIRFHVVAEKARGHSAGRATLLSTSGNSAGWCQAAAAVLGDSVIADVKPLEIESTKGGWSVSGLVSSTSGGRRSRDTQLFFVNRRPIDPPKRLAKFINDTFHQYSSRLWPVVILSFSAAQTMVDVNVTPDKRTVFLHNEESLLADLQQGLTEVWAPSSSTGGLSATLASFGIQGVATSGALASTAASRDAAAAEAEAAIVPMLLSDDTAAMSPPRVPGAPVILDGTPDKLAHPGGTLELADPQAASGRGEKRAFEEAGLAEPLPIADSAMEVDSPDVRLEAASGGEALAAAFLGELALAVVPEPMQEDGAMVVAEPGTLAALPAAPPAPGAKPFGFTNQAHVTHADLEAAVARRRRLAKSTGSALRHRAAAVEQAQPSADLAAFALGASSGSSAPPPPPPPSTSGTSHIPTGFSLASLGEKKASVQDVANFGLGNHNEEASFNFDKGCFAQMRVLGQFNLGFIITALRMRGGAPRPAGAAATEEDATDGLQLFIVDQHASDEKFRFEALNRDSKIDRQPLVVPQMLSLAPAQEAIAESNLELFRLNGFDLSVDSSRPPGRRIKVNTLPTCQGMVFSEKDIHDLIFTIEETQTEHSGASSRSSAQIREAGLLDISSHRGRWSRAAVPRPPKVWQLLACRACRGAIMIGKALRQTEMEKVLLNLGGLQQPWNCPHGRPTMRHLVDVGVARKVQPRAPPLASLLRLPAA